ncbi:MAG: biotin synthase BioB [Candidatus Omnitrophota bacterium]
MDRKQINSLLDLPLAELISRADKVRRESAGSSIELCSIMNAKSGLCGEDCKFCGQAKRHHTHALIYPLKKKAEILKQARRARGIGAERFSVVTSGNRVSAEELNRICDVILEITDKIGIKMCASLGALDKESFCRLKQAGLSRYHHNLETSPEYFPAIASTHTFQDRVDTIKAAKAAGLEVCSGGIIGMGERLEDRISLAVRLKELDVDSAPINVLVPITGTPLENCATLSCGEIIRTIAMFRIILKNKIIKIAAGRETILEDFQALAFLAGANGMLIGGYLTTRGRSARKDRELVREIKELWQTGKDS